MGLGNLVPARIADGGLERWMRQAATGAVSVEDRDSLVGALALASDVACEPERVLGPGGAVRVPSLPATGTTGVVPVLGVLRPQAHWFSSSYTPQGRTEFERASDADRRVAWALVHRCARELSATGTLVETPRGAGVFPILGAIAVGGVCATAVAGWAIYQRYTTTATTEVARAQAQAQVQQTSIREKEATARYTVQAATALQAQKERLVQWRETGRVPPTSELERLGSPFSPLQRQDAGTELGRWSAGKWIALGLGVAALAGAGWTIYKWEEVSPGLRRTAAELGFRPAGAAT